MNADIELFKEYVSAMNERDYDRLKQTLTPDHVFTGIGGPAPGDEAFLEIFRNYTRALPDLVMEIEHIFGSDGFVGARVWHRATHLGDFPAAKATGKRVDFPIHVHARIVDGKLAAVWENWNLLELRKQIGMV